MNVLSEPVGRSNSREKFVQRFAFLLLLTASLGGCASMDTVAEAPLASGVSQSFPASFDSVSGATVKALTTLNVSVTNSEQKPAGLVILVTKQLSAFSWGEVGRIYVQKSTSAPTSVYVLWEKRYQLQISGTGQSEFSDSLFKAIANALPKA